MRRLCNGPTHGARMREPAFSLLVRSADRGYSARVAGSAFKEAPAWNRSPHR